MAFMMKKKRYKFSVECCVEELTEVPFVAAVVLFAKVRLLDGGSFQEHSSREEVKNHTVRWNATFQFICKMSANASTGVLDPSVLRISVRKECKGGRSYQKLGFVDVNLASLAGAGEASRRCLLEGYDARRRQDNSTLRLKIRMNMLSGDPLFKVPSPSLNHKQLLGDGGSISELPEQTPPPAEPPPLPAPQSQAQSQLGQSLTQVDLGRDDCGSSIASGSSGFGSLPKKRPALFGSELLNHQTQTSIMSTEPQPHHQLADFNSSEQTSEESESGGTLQRQRSGSDMLDGCVMSHPVASTHCPACLQGHTHSRNSSNTSGEMSSKASGYGSSLSQQSQHSRQSSEGGDSSEGGRHAPPSSSVHIRRHGPKLIIDRNRKPESLTPFDQSSSEIFHTPNATLGYSPVRPDLIPRLKERSLSPTYDDSAFETPNATILSPISPVDHNKNQFAVPSYFDRKKQDMISLARSAANVLPLSNFHIFKQKSLNTIPDFVERQTAREQQQSDNSGLFHNFPFLTPLANRKNSIIDRSRLSSCNEDDFYLSNAPDIEFRHPIRSTGGAIESYERIIPIQVEGRLSNVETSRTFGHSTPKANDNVNHKDVGMKSRVFEIPKHKFRNDRIAAQEAPKVGLFAKVNSKAPINGAKMRYELRNSKSGVVVSDQAYQHQHFDPVNPLRHSYTVNCVTADNRGASIGVRKPNNWRKTSASAISTAGSLQRENWCRQCGVGVPQPDSDSLPPTLKHRRPSTTALNPSGGCLVMTETGSLDRAKAALERRKHQKGGGGTLGPMSLSSASAESESQTGHAVSGRVENTRVNPDSLIDELLKATNLQVEDSAETSGLQLYIAKDGTAALGSQQIKSQMSQGNRVFKQVVMDDR